MQSFTDSEILETFERGVGCHSLDRGLLALSSAMSCQLEAVADWPLGRRNQRLLELHCLCFGPRLDCWTSCKGCGENVDLQLDAWELMKPARDEQAMQATVSVGAHCFRLPTSRDLAQVVSSCDENDAAVKLLERCCLTGPEFPAWSDTMLEETEEKMASADPLAEIRLAIRCPACGHEWEQAVDIASFVWAEVENRARRLLREVHTLASAYGWTQGEVFALTTARRAMYLDMVQP